MNQAEGFTPTVGKQSMEAMKAAALAFSLIKPLPPPNSFSLEEFRAANNVSRSTAQGMLMRLRKQNKVKIVGRFYRRDGKKDHGVKPFYIVTCPKKKG